MPIELSFTYCLRMKAVNHRIVIFWRRRLLNSLYIALGAISLIAWFRLIAHYWTVLKLSSLARTEHCLRACFCFDKVPTFSLLAHFASDSLIVRRILFDLPFVVLDFWFENFLLYPMLDRKKYPFLTANWSRIPMWGLYIFCNLLDTLAWLKAIVVLVNVHKGHNIK